MVTGKILTNPKRKEKSARIRLVGPLQHVSVFVKTERKLVLLVGKSWVPLRDFQISVCINNIHLPHSVNNQKISKTSISYEFTKFIYIQSALINIFSFGVHCKPLQVYTSNVLTIKTSGTGNCGVPAGKICTIYGKGL